MAEVLASFSAPVGDHLGLYFARAVGRQADDNMWEGWVEFIPVDGGSDVLVSGIESTAARTPAPYLLGNRFDPCVSRGRVSPARRPLTVRVPVIDEPVSDRPAARRVVVQRVIPKPEPVLDPFEIGERNLDILRQELTALNRPRLLNIISAYDMAGDADVTRMSDAELIGLIVAAVESHRSRV